MEADCEKTRPFLPVLLVSLSVLSVEFGGVGFLTKC